VEMFREGLDARSTYWCPRCQPAIATGDARPQDPFV